MSTSLAQTPETDVHGEGASMGRIVWKRFTHHRVAMVSAILLGLTILLVVTSIGIGPIPGWWQWNYTQTNPVLNPRGAPTMGWENGTFVFGAHPFGQDEIGRDIFARVMRGAQQSLMVMVIMGLIATAVGVIVGAFSGFYRGRLDNVLMRMTEVVIAIPTLVLAAVIGKASGGGAIPLAILLGFALWPVLARLVRAEYLSLREREFVDAARVAGASDRTIMFRHILPNSMGVIIVNATLLMAVATILEASLSYLGFGIQFPDVSLGYLINEYKSAFTVRPWLFWWPGVFIITFALTVNLIGDGLRDAFDPRQKRIPKDKDFARAGRAAAKDNPGREVIK
ncbi:MAG: ABC transporter permease [Actinobacteria bacterium HGW-Actinobacteria-4]|nr:MAG: ABC transporter permease [Actinobacteria bacterium HGW-Actinobacteria-4]